MMATILKRYPNDLIPYDANARAGVSRTFSEQLVERALEERINHEGGNGNHFTVNCAAALLVDASGKIVVDNEGQEIIEAAMSEGEAKHAEILLLSRLIKRKGGVQEKGETDQNFILKNLDKLEGCTMELFTERTACVLNPKDKRTRTVMTCDDLFALIKESGACYSRC
jgi:hypothetical protein